MTNSTIELQAKLYLFDLANYAEQFWFKKDESWELCLASGEKKAELERKYHPTLSKKALPETLIKLYGLIKTQLLTAPSSVPASPHSEEMSTSPEFLIAFNRNKMR